MLRETTPELAVARPSLPPLDELAEALEGAWATGYVSGFAAKATEFEARCASYTGLPHAACVANADLGLTLALTALRLPPRSRVVVPSFTFASTLHALLWNRLQPVFVDVDPDTWCVTPETASRGLSERAGAIVATHAFMSAADVGGLERLAADHGTALIFDAAQAFATWIDGRHAGAFGDASVFSFSATKIVTCGEGGLAAFRDGAALERFRFLRAYGSDATYESREVGLNAKLSELHAALGCLTVPRTEDEVGCRAELVALYRERLDGVVGFQACPLGVRPTPTQLVVDAGARRDAVVRRLSASGIDSRTYFRPLHAMPRFRGLARTELPVTERLGRSVVTLPLHSGMDVADVERVCEAVAAA
jgi:dTDP-4-amino-4,6-dideoxygalactose transaminase